MNFGGDSWIWVEYLKTKKEKVYFRSQILERPSIVEYWNISGVPVLPEIVIFTFLKSCWLRPEANNTGMPKWSRIVQYSCTSIWDLKYTFSARFFGLQIFYSYTKYHHHSSSLLSINVCFLFFAYIISCHIGNWIFKKMKKKKVVAKVVDFPDLDV